MVSRVSQMRVRPAAVHGMAQPYAFGRRHVGRPEANVDAR